MPLNPTEPPPILPARAVTAVRTAAHKNRHSLFALAVGGGMFLTDLALGVAFGISFGMSAAFLLGAAFQQAITGSK